ncbi:hypothetical protein jhhlp_001898 [Lomentospora prolificans]|uniref:Palmitoyltransferase n=1 Tax=Lomentospora prolificans TaxID=41688 RepID=A0A2N3NCJ3_9PEZI|nr:hypothetical protein jhhlp_001898 [Lomentospora prolificans]
MDRKVAETSPSTTAHAPIQLSSKSAAAAPVLDSEMELGALSNDVNAATADSPGAHAVPAENDIMQIARVGDVPTMEKLFESGEYDATYTDDDGITPLHWAAINNQYAMCKFLVDHGAEVNKKGGDSVATPLQWAAQRCHYYVVNLLLQHGADPLITDQQGYNTLHIATFNGNVLLLVLLLHQGIPVDVADSYGHTGLMWSAYKGFPQCVDVFLRWGASVDAVDEQGFTALHWALVKGSAACILKLIEYGSDRFAKTESGKTPAITASELNTTSQWHRALRECGYDTDGHPILPPWPLASYFIKDRRGFVTKFLFLFPTVLIWAMIRIVASMPIYAGIPLAIAVGYGLMWCANQVLDHAPSDMRHYQRTESVEPHWLLNIAFLACYLAVCYFYMTCMVYDPGFVPKMKGIAEQKAVIDELLKLWKYDEANFCVTCMIRTPLRSKHCRRCQRCVSKHDHHEGFDANILGDFSDLTPNASDSCNLLSAGICKVVNADTYTLILAIWVTLQLTWVSMLLFVQIIQISRAMTTYENMYGVQDADVTMAFTSTGTPLDPNHPANLTTGETGTRDAHGHSHGRRRHGGGFIKSWARILGVDPFIETVRGRGAATGSAKDRRKKKNPYSKGCIVNCKDFLCDPAPLFGERRSGEASLGGEVVNYSEMYESPRMMEVGRRRRGGYEAVAGEEV